MTGEQVGGIVRTIIAAASGYLIGKGIGDAALWTSVAAAAAAIATAVWSYRSNKPK